MKLEINQIVDHAGPSELLKLSLTEFASKITRLPTQEFLNKIYFHAAVSGADKDAMEVTHQVPGHGGKILVLSLVIYIKKIPGANHIPYPHVITTSMELYHLALVVLKLLHAQKHAFHNTLLTPMPKINTLVQAHTVFTELKKFNKKYLPMDQLKPLSLSIKIS